MNEAADREEFQTPLLLKNLGYLSVWMKNVGFLQLCTHLRSVPFRIFVPFAFI